MSDSCLAVYLSLVILVSLVYTVHWPAGNGHDDDDDDNLIVANHHRRAPAKGRLSADGSHRLQGHFGPAGAQMSRPPASY